MMELDTGLLGVREIEIDLIGGSIEGGRSLIGDTEAIDLTGGGRWQVSIRFTAMSTPAQHRYFNRLARWLNGSVRSIVVPFLVLDTAPLAAPFSDGLAFSDGTGFDGPKTVAATLVGTHPLHAGTITIHVATGQRLRGGEFFSILHPMKGWRAYGIMAIDSDSGGDAQGNGATYTLGITPPLREEVVGGVSLDFRSVRCVMKLPVDETLPWLRTPPQTARPQAVFVEAG